CDRDDSKVIWNLDFELIKFLRTQKSVLLSRTARRPRLHSPSTNRSLRESCQHLLIHLKRTTYLGSSASRRQMSQFLKNGLRRAFSMGKTGQLRYCGIAQTGLLQPRDG